MESNNSTRRTEQESTTFGMASLGTIHIYVIFLLILLTYYSFANGIIVFSWHAPLSTLGLLLLTTNAILAYNPNYSPAAKLDYHSQITYHWVLQVIGMVFSILGFWSAYSDKKDKRHSHYETWHGYLGLLTVICAFLAAPGGYMAKYCVQTRPIIKPVIIKVLHQMIGVVAYVIGIAAMCTGLYSDWMHQYVNGTIINLLIILTVISGALIMIKPLGTILKRVTGAHSN